jgi:hypothetical protein
MQLMLVITKAKPQEAFFITLLARAATLRHIITLLFPHPHIYWHRMLDDYTKGSFFYVLTFLGTLTTE